MKHFDFDNKRDGKHRPSLPAKNFNIVLALLLIVIWAASLSSCSAADLLVFQNDGNTVTGTVELSDRISEEAKNGVTEVILYVEAASEDEIKNITGNMGLFWGSPKEYTILRSIPQSDALKIKFFIEKSNNYYVVRNYLNDEAIPEENTEAHAISEKLKALMPKIIKEDMTDYEKELAIHNWIVKRMKYDKTIDVSSTYNGSYGAMVNRKTMCRGYAESMKLLSECCGLTTMVIVGNATDQDGNDVGHAWNLVELDGKWYHVDTTYDDPVGDNSKKTHHFYFNLNDKDIKKDHRWQTDYFPVCDDDSYMYYKKNNLYYTGYKDFKSAVEESVSYDKPSYLEVLLDADSLYESDLRFMFDIHSVKSVSWSSYSSNPTIVCLSPEYY